MEQDRTEPAPAQAGDKALAEVTVADAKAVAVAVAAAAVEAVAVVAGVAVVDRAADRVAAGAVAAAESGPFE